MFRAFHRRDRPAGSHATTKVNRASPQAQGLLRWWPCSVRTGDGNEIFCPEHVTEWPQLRLNSGTTNDSGSWKSHPFPGVYPDPNLWNLWTEDNADVGLTLPVTVTGWMYYLGADKILFGPHDTQLGDDGFYVAVNASGSNDYLFVREGGVTNHQFSNGCNWSSFANSPDNSWIFMAVSIVDGGTMTGYIGNEFFEPLISATDTIGTLSGNMDTWSTGEHTSQNRGNNPHDLRVYDGILSQERIDQIYRNRFDLWAPVLQWTPFEEPAGAATTFTPSIIKRRQMYHGLLGR